MYARFFCLCLLLTTVTARSQNAANPPEFPYQNADLPTEKRVDDLVSRMTLAEKISQTNKNSPAIPRLGIHAYCWWSEGLHGVARNGIATVFPQAIAMAATWDPALHEQAAEVIATEARSKYNATVAQTGGDTHVYQGITIWSPNINIFRDPRWGRGQETYGEDPFLTGCLGAAFIRGLQGDDPRYLKTVGTLKHFAVHSGPEDVRQKFNSVVSVHDLRETYLPAFEYGVRHGHPWSVMTSYNEVNGVPMPCNKPLLEDVLRAEWGFLGAVVGDVDNVADVWPLDRHHYTNDVAEACALSVKAGNDLCGGNTYDHGLPDALKRGLLTEADLDVALRRLFFLRFKLGQFDPPERVPYSKIPPAACDTPANRELALRDARESLVLLKNDGVLPWKAADLKRVAILGPTADNMDALIGNYSGMPSNPVTILKGLRAKLEPLGVKVTYDSAVPLVPDGGEMGDPLPDGVLFSDDAKTRPGLQRTLFDDKKFAGSGHAGPVDPQIDFLWNEAQPVPDILLRKAHVRWSGELVPPGAGEYTLGVTFIGTVNVTLDGKSLMEYTRRSDVGAVHTLSQTLTFAAGQSHQLQIDYSQNDDDPTGRLFLGWKQPGSLEKALANAAEADHVVLALGITPALEGEEKDRPSIALSDAQQDLISKVAALGKPFVVVLTNGSALSFDVSKPGAILEAWYYGERGGEAVADAIMGDYNPGGRLPVTFYRSDADLPPFADYSMANRTYRYFSGQPLFAFGHGLSFTTFAYQQMTFSNEAVAVGDTVTLAVKLTNTGKRAGDEVVQIYAHALPPRVAAPRQSLVGFQRVTLQPDETKDVVIPVETARLRRWDEKDNRYVVDPGVYEMRVGSASDDIRLRQTLSVIQGPGDK